jgi:hypothetical protein
VGVSGLNSTCKNSYRALIDLRGARTPASGSGGAFWVFRWIAKTIADTHITKILVSSDFDAKIFGEINNVQYIRDDLDNQSMLFQPNIYFSLTNGKLDLPSLPENCIILGIILDVQHLERPEFLPSHLREERNQDFMNTLTQSDVVVTITEAQKTAILRYFPSAIVECLTLHTLLDQSAPIKLERIVSSGKIPPKPYLFYPALNWAHKNHYRLLEAFDFIKSSTCSPLQLVLSGGFQRDTDFDLIEQRRRSSPFVDDIIQLGFVDEETKIELYRNCQLVPFVSLYEGFGLPLIEAQRLGAPLITTKSAVSEEVLGPNGVFFKNANDSKAITEDILEMIDRPTSQPGSYENSLRFNPNASKQSLLRIISHAIENRGDALFCEKAIQQAISGSPVLHLVLIADWGREIAFLLTEFNRFKELVTSDVVLTIVCHPANSVELQSALNQFGLHDVSVYYHLEDMPGLAESAAIRYGGHAEYVLVTNVEMLQLISANRLKLITEFLSVHHLNHVLILTSEAQVPIVETLEDDRQSSARYVNFFSRLKDESSKSALFFRSTLTDLPAFRPHEAGFSSILIEKIRAGFVSLPHVPEIH